MGVVLLSEKYQKKIYQNINEFNQKLIVNNYKQIIASKLHFKIYIPF